MSTKDKSVISELCQFINYLDDCGCLTDEDRVTYEDIMARYRVGFGIHSHEGQYSYLAYSIENTEGERIMEYEYFDDSPEQADALLRMAAEMICFSDCSDEIVEAIVIQGWKIEYVGWQPNMLFEFIDQESGEIIWSDTFPGWEH